MLSLIWSLGVGVVAASNYTDIKTYSTGSYMQELHTSTDSSCSDKPDSVSGWTLGACKIGDGKMGGSIMYSDCTVGTDSLQLTKVRCVDKECSVGCETTVIEQEFCSGTASVTKHTCSASVMAWEDYDFDFHSELYYQSLSCEGDVSFWVTTSSKCTDLSCTYMNTYSEKCAQS